MKKLVVLISLFISLLPGAMSQGVYDDFIYSRQAVQERRVVPWPYLREADVMYAKRIVRMIDVREKQNQPMAWPKNPLSVILYNAVAQGKLIPYRNDSLTSQLTIEEFLGRGTDTSFQETPIDPNDPEITKLDTLVEEFRPEERIKKFRIVEDWIFDKKHSTMYVRIISIAPRFMFRVKGVDIQEQDLCVLKYHAKEGSGENDIRHLLVNYEVFNRQNDAARLTFDDWFEQRMFYSYIIKEANQHDMYIKEYAEFKDNGLAAVLEGERIKQELFEKEHDLWEY
ncbi:MAG: gliding motility protein GldN [Bacteroidia bacterium]